jgi:hypothetical protein
MLASCWSSLSCQLLAQPTLDFWSKMLSVMARLMLGVMLALAKGSVLCDVPFFILSIEVCPRPGQLPDFNSRCADPVLATVSSQLSVPGNAVDLPPAAPGQEQHRLARTNMMAFDIR